MLFPQLLVFVAHTAVAIALVVADKARANTPTANETEAGAPSPPTRPALDLHIPDALDEMRFQESLARLNLTSEQTKLAHDAFDLYQQEVNRLQRSVIPPLLVRSKDFAGEKRRLNSEVRAQQYEDLLDDRDKVVEAIARNEATLLSRLEALLDESQRGLMPEIRRRHLRDHYAFSPVHCPGSHLDLTTLVDQFRSERGVSAFTDEEGLRSVLLEYDVLVTPLFRSRFEKALKAAREATLLQEAYQREWGGVPAEMPPEQRQAFMADRELALAPPVTVAKSISTINAVYFKRIAVYVNEHDVLLFTKRFHQSAYPAIFPDPYELDDALIVPLLQTRRLKDSMSPEWAMIVDEYRRKRDENDLLMIREFSEYAERFARTFAAQGDAIREFTGSMTRLHKARQANARLFLERAVALLPDRSDKQTEALLQRADALVNESFEPPKFVIVGTSRPQAPSQPQR